MRRWTIINGILVIMVVLLGFEIARTWGRVLPAIDTAPRAGSPDQPHEKGGGKKGGGDKAAAARAQQQPPVLVAAIGDKDLFDPTRRPPAVD